jgi:hypothetical protein
MSISPQISTLSATALLLVLVTNDAWAQTEIDPAQTVLAEAPDGAAHRIYPADFFEVYAPVSALNMINRIPGFSLSAGDTARRGLADSFGNLLIDGDRPSNKSLSLQTVLQRIPAGDVARIELIERDVPGIDRHGHALLANVILHGDVSASGSYQIMWQGFQGGRVNPQVSASITQPFDRGEWIAGVELSLWSPRWTRQRSVADAAGTTTSRSDETDQVLDQGINSTFSLSMDLDDGASLQLDAEAYFWAYSRGFSRATETPIAGNFQPASVLTSESEDHGASYGFSGNYQRPLTTNLSAQNIIVASVDIMKSGPERLEFFLAGTGLDHAEIVRFTDRQEEYAIRQNFTWRPQDNQTVEFGAETAINRGDTQLAIQLEQGGVTTDINLPVANTEIEEQRSEVFAQHTWTIDERLTLTSGLRWEFSSLSLTGDAIQDRDFSYFKPSLTLDYRADVQNRLRLSLRRDVDQLDFSKFASSVDITDNNATIGNPNYVPQNSWIAQAEFERRWTDTRTFLLRLDHSWVSDLDDWIAVASGTSVFDAPGNLGDGTRLRAHAEYSTDLAALGVTNAQFDLGYTYQDTNVTDPLTGTDRSWSGIAEHRVTTAFRQNLPAQQLAWGWDYSWETDRSVYRARETRLETYPDGSLNIYAETSRWANAILRLGVRGLTDVSRNRQRVFFDGSRATGIISATEDRVSDHGSLVYVQLTGTF